MKVYIGPFRNWWGPYQIADLLQKVGVSEDRCHAIGEWLAETWVDKVCQWVHSKKKRKVKVKLHVYDHWNAYHTIALVALPVMEALREHKCSAGFIEDEDVPDNLKSSSAPDKEYDYDADENWFPRYDWALDEVIFALSKIVDEDDWEWEYRDEDRERVQHGLKLFGKYFMSFWD